MKQFVVALIEIGVLGTVRENLEKYMEAIGVSIGVEYFQETAWIGTD